jgi:hypothetical protein
MLFLPWVTSDKYKWITLAERRSIDALSAGNDIAIKLQQRSQGALRGIATIEMECGH